MTTTKRIIDNLGGPRALRGKVATLNDLRTKLREGLPYAAFEILSARYDIDTKEMTAILAVPERTLARRKKERRFRADESDRLFRLSRVVAMAEEALGSREKATRWLHAPNRALGNEAPLGQVDTDLGARQVEDVLLRIAHGVHS